MSSLEEEVLKENISAAESYGEQFSDRGPIYYWKKEAERILEIWKIYLAIKLLTPLNFFIKNLSPLPRPPLANLK